MELDRDLSLQVARMVGESSALDAVAEEIVAEAKANAAKHRRTGAFSNAIRSERAPGKNGVTDRQVFSDAPFANIIELGHIASGWFADIAPGRWIPGIHALRDAGHTVQRKVRR